ncbi:TRAP transporter substrate-binding protein [Thermovirga lienii]|uniref:TRAP transporter substrate-binding protein n=1 Tax=Thermovirga lienii TaxID=336261 RepID=UPI000ED0D540|nr:C4-dicarboxylate ABC transporter substrate-binding protein [Thermovirga lienii]
MRKLFALLVVFSFLLVGVQGAFAKGLNIKLAHVVNEKDAFHVCALKFKEVVEAKSNGEITVTIYPNAKLGDERALLEGMKMGVVDAGIITSGPIINFIPEFGVFDLPFLFRSPEHAYAVLDGPIGTKMLKKMETQGWKGLAYGERGFRNLTNSKRPVVTPDDVKGLKIRLMQNPIYVDAFKALGANAVPMAWTEALTVLQQKTIDGQENPLNVIVAFKLYESQKYLSLTRHAYAPNVIMMSMKTWKKLTPEQQAIIQEAATEASKANRQYDNDKAAEWLAFLKEQGMEVVEKPDLEAFRKAVEPVYEKYGASFGEDVLKAIAETKAN